MAQRSRIRWVDPPPHDGLRARLCAGIGDQIALERRVVSLDIHLIEAALASDEIVVSLDKGARRRFSRLASPGDPLARVHWEDPSEEDSIPAVWLNKGCPRVPGQMLGHDRDRADLEDRTL